MSEANNTLTMDQPVGRSLLERGRQGVVGKPVDRIDGVLKVTGAARYANEKSVDNAAYGFMLSTEFARGRIIKVDAKAARAAPGVIAVITDHPLIPSDSAGAIEARKSPLELPMVNNYGTPIGIVVAESFEAARAAARLVRVDYESEPGRFEIDRHLGDADHDPPNPLTPNAAVGDFDAAFAASDVTLDLHYSTPHQFAAAMEPHATTAVWRGDTLEIHSSLQLLHWAQDIFSQSLEIDPSKVRVLAPYVGGGFGGKTGVGAEAVLAAIAAREIGRPVKVALTRRQMAHLTHRRSETRQRVRIGATSAGKILAIAHESYVSQKDGRGFIEPVSLGSLSLYAGDARRFSQSLVRLDLPMTSAVRAPGESIGTLASETAMDEMAEKLGLDPIAFRKLNEPEKDPLHGVPFSTRRLLDCYDEGARRFGWEKRNPKPGAVREGDWLIGMGMAAATRSNLLVSGQSRVTLTPEGGAIVETDMTDIGTGTYTILAQVAGEMLGLPVDQIEIRLGDTEFPHGPGSGGSFGAAASASSVALACEELIGRLARKMDAGPEELALQDGMATARNRRVSLKELLAGEPMEALGTIHQGTNATTTSQWANGAHFAEVAVNAVTGEPRVRRMVGVFDCGRLLNAKTARSQAIGGMIWGISYALHEEAVVDPRTGAFVTRDLAEYHVASNADIPQIEAYFIEESDKFANPLGIKGIGELGISGSGAAVVNAIYNACGVRARDFPLTLDKILEGLPAL
jgi:xanthine dehydrogenase YagR molybdenum-binding subunit